MKVIQENGDRHYQSPHGVYIIRNFYDEGWCEGDRVWEIFAPYGRNFDTAHSLLESSLSYAKEWIGKAYTKCDGTCGCDFQ